MTRMALIRWFLANEGRLVDFHEFPPSLAEISDPARKKRVCAKNMTGCACVTIAAFFRLRAYTSDPSGASQKSEGSTLLQNLGNLAQGRMAPYRSRSGRKYMAG